MKNINKKKFGFTLVELLVVIAIIAILTMISASSYISVQIKARDAKRKSDLDAVSKALMLYYSDTGSFPAIFNFGDSSVGFRNSGIVYMRETPEDPRNRDEYTYVYAVSPSGVSFNLFANLENKKDPQCRVTSFDVNGQEFCYGLASPNTVPGTTLP